MSPATPLTAVELVQVAQLGDLIRFSDGAPRPPERFNKKLSAWKNRNDVGTLTKIDTDGSHPSFTLHMGDLGAGGVILMRVYRTYGLDSDLTFTIERKAQPGSYICCRQFRGTADVQEITPDRDKVDAWRSRNPDNVVFHVEPNGSRTIAFGELEAAA